MVYKDPRMIIFEEKECCALRLAFQENGTAINDFLKGFVPTKIIGLCQSILEDTQRLGWIPGVEDHETVYRQVAEMEIKRLGRGALNKDSALACRCKTQAHIEALQRVVRMTGASFSA